jgi:hypothetical protein
MPAKFSNFVISACGACPYKYCSVRHKDEASVMSSSLRMTALAGAVVCAGVAAVPDIAAARTSYDGAWSVVIITRSGTCDSALRYQVQINNGYVLNEAGSVNLQGRVASNGAVRVSVSAGGQWANGSGRLSRRYGSGLWRGQGSAGTCAGVWQAERR